MNDFVKLRRSVTAAARSLWLHKLRTILSVLGIIIGTSAVIALMAFGKGSMQDALEDIKRQGATNIIVRAVKPVETSNTSGPSRIANYGMTMEDVAAFRSALGESLTRCVPMRIFTQRASAGTNKVQVRLVGTTPEYAVVNKLEVAAGRFLRDGDGLGKSSYCVLGAGVAEKLFPFGDPVGEQVHIKEETYTVIGVVEPRMPTGGSGGSQAAEDFNDDVYLPLQRCNDLYGIRVYIRQAGNRIWEQVPLHQVTMTVSDMEHVRSAGEQIREVLEGRHQKKDWLITVPLDRLEEAERAADRYTQLLALIASISLLVGGIGIMNIMLATVTERTREIGIRRALGAKQGDITSQFLIEAVVQTTVGGVLGVLAGLTMIFAIPPVYEWLSGGDRLPAEVHVQSVFLAFTVSIVVGLVFGWFPARRAAKLDPIEALRHD